MCAMELRNVRVRSGNQAIGTDRPAHDAPPANDAHQAQNHAPEHAHARLGQADGSSADRAAAVTSPTPERERATVPGERLALPARPSARVDLGRQRLAERLERAENPATTRTELRERLNNLEPGHPSSPREADSTPRPPTPRLSDLERPDPPLSDAAYAAHREAVKDDLEHAIRARLTTKDQFAVDSDGQTWIAKRRWVHDEIINEIYNAAADIPCERKAVIAGGLGGAGKTTVLEKHANIDRSNFLTINPDEFKEELARRGLVPEVPGLSPMEASSLVHEESSHIARTLAIRALADGKNVIWDVTLSTPRSAAYRVEELRAAGYREIQGIFIDIPIETSVARAIGRHRHGHDRYLAGEGLGGRYVSEDIIRSQTDLNYSSLNRAAFEGIKGQLSYWAIYDNSVDGRQPVLLEEGRHEPENRVHQG